MTTVGAAAAKTGTNDVSGGRRWCPNLSTSFFYSCFSNMPQLLPPRLKMEFGLVHAMQSNGPHYKSSKRYQEIVKRNDKRNIKNQQRR
jgi:hypothetical protein